MAAAGSSSSSMEIAVSASMGMSSVVSSGDWDDVWRSNSFLSQRPRKCPEALSRFNRAGLVYILNGVEVKRQGRTPNKGNGKFKRVLPKAEQVNAMHRALVKLGNPGLIAPHVRLNGEVLCEKKHISNLRKLFSVDETNNTIRTRSEYWNNTSCVEQARCKSRQQQVRVFINKDTRNTLGGEVVFLPSEMYDKLALAFEDTYSTAYVVGPYEGAAFFVRFWSHYQPRILAIEHAFRLFLDNRHAVHCALEKNRRDLEVIQQHRRALASAHQRCRSSSCFTTDLSLPDKPLVLRPLSVAAQRDAANDEDGDDDDDDEEETEEDDIKGHVGKDGVGDDDIDDSDSDSAIIWGSFEQANIDEVSKWMEAAKSAPAKVKIAGTAFVCGSYEAASSGGVDITMEFRYSSWKIHFLFDHKADRQVGKPLSLRNAARKTLEHSIIGTTGYMYDEERGVFYVNMAAEPKQKRGIFKNVNQPSKGTLQLDDNGCGFIFDSSGSSGSSSSSNSNSSGNRDGAANNVSCPHQFRLVVSPDMRSKVAGAIAEAEKYWTGFAENRVNDSPNGLTKPKQWEPRVVKDRRSALNIWFSPGAISDYSRCHRDLEKVWTRNAAYHAGTVNVEDYRRTDPSDGAHVILALPSTANNFFPFYVNKADQNDSRLTSDITEVGPDGKQYLTADSAVAPHLRMFVTKLIPSEAAVKRCKKMAASPLRVSPASGAGASMHGSSSAGASSRGQDARVNTRTTGNATACSTGSNKRKRATQLKAIQKKQQQQQQSPTQKKKKKIPSKNKIAEIQV